MARKKTQESELTPRQRRFVAAMLTARTIAEAAAEVGVTERTGQNYAADPAVKAALGQALDGVVSQAARQAAGELSASLTMLAAVRDDQAEPIGARVRAATVLLATAPGLREAADLGERVSELESRILGGAKTWAR